MDPGINFLDLFSGIGGFALGAKMAKVKIAHHYCSDILEVQNAIYKKNFPKSIQLGDIKTISGRNLPKGRWVISGGFPCQDISQLGKKARLNGERSSLVYEQLRLIEELQPSYCFFENVREAKRPEILGRILWLLHGIGYDAQWYTICASDIGAPHTRERLWITAYPTKGTQSPIPQETSWFSKRDSYLEKAWLSLRIARLQDHTLVNWQASNSKFCGDYDGIPTKLDKDRVGALGNAIVPQIAKALWESLM